MPFTNYIKIEHMKNHILFILIILSLAACKSKKERLLNTVWDIKYSIYNETGVINFGSSIIAFGKGGKFYNCEMENGQISNCEPNDGFHIDVFYGPSTWDINDDTLKSPIGNFVILKLNSDTLVINRLKYNETFHCKRINLKLPENIK